MKVIVMVKASKDSEAGVLPTPQLLADMGRYNEELVKAGIMQAGEGLQPSSKGFRVRFSGKNRTVTKGPFAETSELVAGFWLWQVKSMDEALEWVKRCPNPMLEDSDIEIRPLYSPEDFARIDPSGELRHAEERLREESERLQQNVPRLEIGREMIVAGIHGRFTAETAHNIPAQWERFVPSLGKIAGRVGRTTYGVCMSCNADGSFDYLSGVEVNDTSGLPSGFTAVQIPAQRYAAFTHRGHVSEMGQAIQDVWNRQLPASGYVPAQPPSFERYTEEFNPQTGRGGMEIWIPIKE